MGCGYVRVNSTALANDVDNIKSSLERISMAVDEMYDQVNVLNSMWKGTANSAFQEKFAGDYQDIKSFIEEIKDFADKLENDRREYERCERDVISMIESVRI